MNLAGILVVLPEDKPVRLREGRFELRIIPLVDEKLAVGNVPLVACLLQHVFLERKEKQRKYICWVSIFTFVQMYFSFIF
jgi:hypothetical protein